MIKAKNSGGSMLLYFKNLVIPLLKKILVT